MWDKINTVLMHKKKFQDQPELEDSSVWSGQIKYVTLKVSACFFSTVFSIYGAQKTAEQGNILHQNASDHESGHDLSSTHCWSLILSFGSPLKCIFSPLNKAFCLQPLHKSPLEEISSGPLWTGELITDWNKCGSILLALDIFCVLLIIINSGSSQAYCKFVPWVPQLVSCGLCPSAIPFFDIFYLSYWSILHKIIAFFLPFAVLACVRSHLIEFQSVI